ncbi:NAD(P)-dependent oxidoreductase [Noviherbaspirillum sp.]|uniref:NAD(P)-dependent oxidoreductase n=1 Tax=Noviherbaspirillum sp. TaxID=1926288 RepID=UPI002B48DCA9|nr:NAD(P)-dependent oxidoreductase [Noviherbaspirillum sp.]HJV81558.1 NAD(P)-dependent oxidoreductase [Noviherbaspirillum sp.]
MNAAMEHRMKIGFIGLGRMGTAIAGRLLRHGFDLAVYNRTPEKAADLAKAGARVATSIADVCGGRNVVITMLADDAAIDAVVLGQGGVRDSLAAGAIHIAMGTHGVDAIRALDAAHRQGGQQLVAAPVLGRPDAAEAGQLGIVAAGPAEAVAACQPVFDVIGKRTFKAGDGAAGAAAIKLSNNFLLGCCIEAMGEAFSLVRKYGVAPEVLYDVLTEGLFAAPAYKVYGRLIVDEAYDKVGFATLLGLKDINLVLAAGQAERVPLPSASNLRDRLLGAIAHGDGDKDWAVVAREQARASGLE